MALNQCIWCLKKVLTVGGVLMLPMCNVRDASPQPRVTARRHGQTYQLSPTHLNPLLCLDHAHCSHQHHHQRHQTLSGRHCAIVIAPQLVRVDERWGWGVTYEELKGVYIVNVWFQKCWGHRVFENMYSALVKPSPQGWNSHWDKNLVWQWSTAPS